MYKTLNKILLEKGFFKNSEERIIEKKVSKHIIKNTSKVENINGKEMVLIEVELDEKPLYEGLEINVNNKNILQLTKTPKNNNVILQYVAYFPKNNNTLKYGMIYNSTLEKVINKIIEVYINGN